MKIQYGSIFGQFKWTAEAEISDELVAALVPLGALQIAQRSPSTAAEKELAGYDKRPEKFSRTKDINYSEANAKVLAKHLETVQVEIGRDEKDKPVYKTFAATVVVEQHTPGEADVKMADERKAYARNGEKNTLAKLAAKVGFAGEVGDGKSENAPVEFLRAIRAWAKAQVADI